MSNYREARVPLPQTLLVVLSAAPASSQVVDVLAVSGGKRFLGFEAPLVGPNGEIAFVALNRRSRQAVYFQRGGKLRSVARQGRRAPGMPSGYVFLWPEPIGFDGSGRLYLAAHAEHRGGGALVGGIWRTVDDSGLELLVREGQVLPGIGPLDPLLATEVGSSGHLAFQDQPERILLRSPEGEFSVIADLDSSPVGAPPGASFLGFTAFRVDAAGSVTFEGIVDQDGFGEPGGGIWRRAPSGELSLLALRGTTPPGADAPLDYVAIEDVNGAGAAALSGFLRLAPLPSEACVLLAEGGSTMLAARANTPAPGAPGYVFESFFDTWIADDGRVLFESFVETPDAGMTGAWTFDDAAGISLLLREGGPAPGEPGATLAWPTAIHAGRSGDVVFQAAYAEGGVPDLEHVATLFAPAGAGAPRVLVRHGDPVRLRSGKLVPAFFQLPEFLVPRDLTPVDAGRVAMQAFLDDGRVAIVVIDAPVP